VLSGSAWWLSKTEQPESRIIWPRRSMVWALCSAPGMAPICVDGSRGRKPQRESGGPATCPPRDDLQSDPLPNPPGSRGAPSRAAGRPGGRAPPWCASLPRHPLAVGHPPSAGASGPIGARPERDRNRVHHRCRLWLKRLLTTNIMKNSPKFSQSTWPTVKFKPLVLSPQCRASIAVAPPTAPTPSQADRVPLPASAPWRPTPCWIRPWRTPASPTVSPSRR